MLLLICTALIFADLDLYFQTNHKRAHELRKESVQEEITERNDDALDKKMPSVSASRVFTLQRSPLQVLFFSPHANMHGLLKQLSLLHM